MSIVAEPHQFYSYLAQCANFLCAVTNTAPATLLKGQCHEIVDPRFFLSWHSISRDIRIDSRQNRLQNR
jgi:hypothetical protein